MATVAVLGMGLLGAGFAHKLLDDGHTVRVWNRTASRCAPLVECGAVAAASPAEAVAGADRVHLVLSEDDAVDGVLDGLLEALPEGVPVIDHSTNAPARVGERVARLKARGVDYLHAPVFMGPQNARKGNGAMLVSGDPALIDRVLRDLDAMTGSVKLLGDDPTRAAAVKLGGNAMLLVITAAMGDVFQIGTHNGMTPEESLELFSWFAPSAKAMGRRILADGPASFTLEMARKDARLMIESAEEGALVTLPAVADRMDAAIAEGLGALDFAQFVRRV